MKISTAFSLRSLLSLFLFLIVFSSIAGAQTGTINYQGRLTEGGAAAGGTYEMKFTLHTAASGTGNQLGAELTDANVQVTQGAFTVQLNFAAANAFDGGNRWIEISVKKPAEAAFTTLSPRQQVFNSPYAIRTLSASVSDSLSSNCAGCVKNANIDSGISYSKLSGAPTSLPPSGAAGGDLTGTYPNPTIGAGKVGVTKISATGTASAGTFLRGDGTWSVVSASNLNFPRVGVIANAGNTSYNVQSNDVIVGVDMSAGTNFTVRLPPATTAGKILIIKIERYNNAILPVLTIQPNGTDKINGLNNDTFGNAGGSRSYYCDGAGNWYSW